MKMVEGVPKVSNICDVSKIPTMAQRLLDDLLLQPPGGAGKKFPGSSPTAAR